MVAGIRNVLGVKVLNGMGMGVEGVTAIIRNKNGDSITKIETKRFGHAKVELTPELGNEYYAEIVSGDKIKREFLLPIANGRGINITISHIKKERLLIVLGANESFKREYSNKLFHLYIHRDGLLKKLEVTFPANKNYTSILLDKHELTDGVNILTLLDENGRPMLERMLFNMNGLNKDRIRLFKLSSDKDSIAFVLKSMSKNTDNNFSVSVLPKNTKSYNHEDNILSAFLLKPYLKGHIENPSYYFRDFSKKKENELDLLLLTQGWSKYEWQDMMKNPPKKKFAFERGISAVGTVNSKLRKKSKLIYFQDELNNSPFVVDLPDNKQNFNLQSYFVEKGTKLSFSLFDGFGELSRPQINLVVKDGNFVDSIDTEIRQKIHKLPKTYENFIVKDLLVPDNTIKLDEVVVTESYKRREFSSKTIFDNKLKKVTKATTKMYPNFVDIVRSRGFKVIVYPTSPPPQVSISTKIPLSFDNKFPPPVLYVDDVQQPDFDILNDIGTANIESYYIDRSGNGGAGAGGGVIRIYTKARYNDLGGQELDFSNKKFYEYIFKKGFEPYKEFYSPTYLTTQNSSFRDYGVIHWESNLSTHTSSEVIFKIPKTGLSEATFFVEGMGLDGRLFSAIRTINLD
ncbi:MULTISPECIES: hypothetical protein [unclassified Croceitalea]|uniref:hypothetical protein n=1 Tax=unclassified Croceitalea TaxID=2632280 RepID=UPI0030DBF835